MDADDQRSLEARTRAETALVRLLHEIGDAPVAVTILGGLVPAILAQDRDDAPPHIGTSDVDVLLITHIAKAEGLVAVERALHRMAFRAVNSEGWRWRGVVEGHAVRIEFLCDLPEYRQGEAVRPPHCRELAACNLRGTGYVSLDSELHELTGSLTDGTTVTVRTRFAGLGGYLLSKLVAVRSRAATKDHYDLVYVLINNAAGGPAAAAALLRGQLFESAVRELSSTLDEVRERFRRTMDFGPVQYAEQADPGQDPALLRADAVSAASQFFASLLAGEH